MAMSKRVKQRIRRNKMDRYVRWRFACHFEAVFDRLKTMHDDVVKGRDSFGEAFYPTAN